jgi:hypothetical protein
MKKNQFSLKVCQSGNPVFFAKAKSVLKLSLLYKGKRFQHGLSDFIIDCQELPLFAKVASFTKKIYVASCKLEISSVK